MLTNTLCVLQNSVHRQRIRRADTLSFPHYLLQYIPAEEETCLFELLCLLKTFQGGFPTLRVVLVAGESGGGWTRGL